MLLCVDIGNTNVSFGVFKQDKLQRSFNIPSRGYGLNKLKRALNKLKIDNAVICSVVPKLTVRIEKDLKIISGKQPLLIGKQRIVPIKNLYRNPKQVGQDRLVNAYAGVKLYAAPLVIIDFGTAITFDVISKKNEYLGGMILPGLLISLEALHQHTALLPKIRLEEPKEFIGRKTKESILSGIVNGFSALCDNLVTRIKKRIGENTKVIGTGGNISLMRKYCKRMDAADIHLTLKGLNMLFHNKKIKNT